MRTVDTIAGIALLLAITSLALTGYTYMMVTAIISELEKMAAPMQEAQAKIVEFEQMGAQLKAIMPMLEKLPQYMPLLEQLIPVQ